MVTMEKKKNLRNFSHGYIHLPDSRGVSRAPKATLGFNFHPHSWRKHKVILRVSDSGFIACLGLNHRIIGLPGLWPTLKKKWNLVFFNLKIEGAIYSVIERIQWNNQCKCIIYSNYSIYINFKLSFLLTLSFFPNVSFSSPHSLEY